MPQSNDPTLINEGRHFIPQSNDSTLTNGGRHFEPQSNNPTSTNKGRHFKPQDTIPNDLTKIAHITGGRGETLQTPTFGDKQLKVKVHRNFNFLDYKFKPIKPKEGSTLISQERIEDVLNSILEGQERINEELAQISWIANSALQASLANQSMLSTMCKDNSPEPEEMPHFQFLKKRARDFNKLSFQLSSPINKNMSMDSIPEEVVPYHISNSAIKPSTGNYRRGRNISKLHMTSCHIFFSFLFSEK